MSAPAPLRDHVGSGSNLDVAGSSTPIQPRHTLSSSTVGPSSYSSPAPPPTTGGIYGRDNNAARSLRTQTIARISGGSSFSSAPTPRTRLARGRPPWASVRTRRRGPHRRPPHQSPDPPTLVRYHWSTIVLLVLYLPLLIVPWIMVCVLDVKPLVLYGKDYQTAGWYTPTDIAWVPRWVRASNILACACSAFAFPLVTAVVSHASVVFVQNVRPGQRVNARQLLSLADECWVRVAGDRRMWLAKAGTTLTVLSMIVPLLQISAVRVDQVQVAACNDVPYPKNNNKACRTPLNLGYVVGGYDPEPSDMAYAPGNLMARQVRNQLSTFSNLRTLDHIWPNVAGMGDNWVMNLGDMLYYYQRTSVKNIPFYVSNFPQSFNTGVLREHAVRFNSTASCEMVPRSWFPSSCPGTNPLAGEFSSRETQNRFCVPGDYTVHPWTIDRDRQDITEELWVDNYIPYGSQVLDVESFATSNVKNLTLHCVASTTRGYFELPNYHNDGEAGPLLTRWPSQEVLEAEFDDVETLSTAPPSDADPRNLTDVLVFRYGPDPLGSWNQKTPGPLAVLVNAMLGNESWFYQVRNASTAQEGRDALVAACIRGLPFATYTGYVRNGFAAPNGQCSFLNYQGKVPQVRLASTSSSAIEVQIARDVGKIVAEWFSGFGFGDSTTQDVLEAGMYLANEALLGLTADASRAASARPVHISNGTAVLKPSVRIPAKATVSLLVLLETGGLVALAVFIYRVPTLASRLDAVHVAAIGAQLARQGEMLLPPLGLHPRGRARQRHLKELEDADGLIGVREEVEMMPMSHATGGMSTTTTTTTITRTPRTSLSATLTGTTPAASLYTNNMPAAVPPPHLQPSSLTNNNNTTHHRRIISGPFNLRPLPRPISFASTTTSSHMTTNTNSIEDDDDDIISVLDAVSEAHAVGDHPQDHPDGSGGDFPPKYSDVIQADDARRFGPPYMRKTLVVGESGRITRDLAVSDTNKKKKKKSKRAGGEHRGSGIGAGQFAARPMAWGNNNRSNRSSFVGQATAAAAGGGQSQVQPSGFLWRLRSGILRLLGS